MSAQQITHHRWAGMNRLNNEPTFYCSALEGPRSARQSRQQQRQSLNLFKNVVK